MEWTIRIGRRTHDTSYQQKKEGNEQKKKLNPNQIDFYFGVARKTFFKQEYFK